MKIILCVIDLTEASARVLEEAGKAAAGYNAHLKILFPYRLIGYHISDAVSSKAKLEMQASEKFNELIRKATISPEVSYEFIPEIGFPAHRIKYHINDSNIDMVIIGEHQADTLNDLRETTLFKFISQSKVPFMIVPEVAKVETI